MRETGDSPRICDVMWSRFAQVTLHPCHWHVRHRLFVDFLPTCRSVRSTTPTPVEAAVSFPRPAWPVSSFGTDAALTKEQGLGVCKRITAPCPLALQASAVVHLVPSPANLPSFLFSCPRSVDLGKMARDRRQGAYVARYEERRRRQCDCLLDAVYCMCCACSNAFVLSFVLL